MRLIQICLLGLLLGCSGENTAPPPFTPQQREAIKQNLTALGAKVTADDPEGLYLSLRNTHVQVRDLGGIIEGDFKTQRDVQDFGTANEAVAKGFLEPDEFEEFKAWLREALSPRAPAVSRAEYNHFKVTLARDPLRTIFTRKKPSEEQ